MSDSKEKRKRQIQVIKNDGASGFQITITSEYEDEDLSVLTGKLDSIYKKYG